MKIGGLQPLSLSDFPGLMAAIVFTQGCNFRCPFCHNGSLLETDPEYADPMLPSSLYDFLKRRRRFLDGIVVSGGEPTIQSDIVEFIEMLRCEGYKVKLDTNGSRPAVLRQLLDRHLLDYVAMDIKAPLGKYAQLAGVDVPVEGIRESMAQLLASDIAYEFRTTFVPGLLTQQDLDDIRSYLPKEATYRIQGFVPDHALEASLRSVTPSPVTDEKDNTDLPRHIDLLSGE